MPEGGAAARGKATPATRGARAKPKAPTKSQVHAEVAEAAGVSKAEVGKVLDALKTVMARNLRTHKTFSIEGLAKVVVVNKPATAARPGRNPFTGEEIMIKAKPARDAVKVRPLKPLKDMV